jgi:hypothetical protein
MLSSTIRRWHSYIGLFIAPSVIFFALTGATQLYGLHEAHGDYRPPAILEKLSSLHKDQVFAFGHHHDPAPDADPGKPGAAPDDDDKEDTSTVILKGFFLIVALGLTFSSAFGAWMGLTQIRQPRLALALLIGGALIPVVLVLI